VLINKHHGHRSNFLPRETDIVDSGVTAHHGQHSVEQLISRIDVNAV